MSNNATENLPATVANDPQELEHQIRQRAQELHDARGREVHELDDWLRAEEEITGRKVAMSNDAAPAAMVASHPPELENQIRQRAQELHDARGREVHELDDWLRAEGEITGSKVAMSNETTENPTATVASHPQELKDQIQRAQARGREDGHDLDGRVHEEEEIIGSKVAAA